MNTEIALAELPKEVPVSVKTSDYGCNNCLWAGIECKAGSMYKAGTPSRPCAGYTYCD